jgi:hypothetical protein
LKIFRKKFPKPPPAAVPDTEEQERTRRLAKIVHDERGAASVEWHEAPKDWKRPVFKVEESVAVRNSKVRGGIEVLHIKNNETFNPYERQLGGSKKESAATRRDLRKLSEHIKLMRELEERKKRGGDEE